MSQDVGLVKPSGRFMELGRGFVARTLVTADNVVPLRLANILGEVIPFTPGTHVTSLYRIQSVKEPRVKRRECEKLPEHLSDFYNRATEGFMEEDRKQEIKILMKYANKFLVDNNDLGTGK